jgi:UDP-glucose 4-epimerase
VTRDYFYVGDLADALIAAAEHHLNSERVFNIGGGREISLRNLVERVEATVGKEARVHYEEARGFDVPRLCLDTTRAEEELAWNAHVGLDEGLARTWRWMQRTFES